MAGSLLSRLVGLITIEPVVFLYTLSVGLNEVLMRFPEFELVI